jgi:hypothetical protein
MNQPLDEQRAEILKMVESGLILPTTAEGWARNNNCASFSTNPNPTCANPMQFELWTLPMAAAWFIWRSPVAVFHQSDEARVNWKRWIVTEPAKNALSGPRCGIVDLGPAKLWDVFYEARWDPGIALLDRHSAKGPVARAPDPCTDFPYARLRIALQTGRLAAMRSGPRESKRERVPPEYWRENFDQLARPLERAQQQPEEAQFFFQRAEVVEAETEIASREFEMPTVGLEQALGWVAYRSEENFRSLSQADLKGKTYCGQCYEPDFKNRQPEKELFEFLVDGKINGYRSGSELTLAERMKMTSVWDAVDVKFFRNELIEIWPSRAIPLAGKNIRTQDPPPAGRPSQSSVAISPRPPKRRTGPSDHKFVAAKDAVFQDIQSKTRTPQELLKMPEKEFQRAYGDCSRHIARKIRNAVSEFVANSNNGE